MILGVYFAMNGFALLLTMALAATPLQPGEHARKLTVDKVERNYLVHIPKSYDPAKPTAAVLALHGAAMNGALMKFYTGLSEKAEKENFFVIYPDGSGAGPVYTWNAGGFSERIQKARPDDVKFLIAVLDDVASVVNVDPKRVYATGMSNGAMMCYLLAAEHSDRIAAIAPVAGTMAFDKLALKRPVPVLHFHGTKDTLVPYGGLKPAQQRFFKLKSVDETLACWCDANGCKKDAKITALPDKTKDDTTVNCHVYPLGKQNAEVILYEVVEGGHTWPGKKQLVEFLGNTTLDIAANDLMWEFFVKHPLP